MFCTNCGKKLDDDAAFCIYCGGKVDGTVPVIEESAIQLIAEKAATESTRRGPSGNEIKAAVQKYKKQIIVAAVAIAVLTGAITGVGVYNKPTAKLDRAIKAEDLVQAVEIFNDNFDPDDLSDRTNNLLKETASKIGNDYLSGTITYEDADTQLGYIRDMGTADVLETLSNVYVSMENKHQVELELDYADERFGQGDYLAAINAYANTLTMDESNAVAKAGLEKSRIAYKDTVISEANSYADSGEISVAVETLQNAVVYLGEDSEIQSALEKMRDKEIEAMVIEVYSAADEGHWDEAINLLDIAQETYPDAAALEDARADILSRKPVTLKSLAMVNEDEVDLVDGEVTDRWGNPYDGAVDFDASLDSFALYNLSKAYSTFTATVIVPTVATSGKNMSVTIYLDDQEAYRVDNITEEIKPIKISLDVTGADTMRIVTSNEGSYPYGWLYFVNSNFTKVAS